MVHVQKILDRIDMRTCIIIPTYNESREISGIVRSIRQYGLDCLVVDDGSEDNTAKIARESGALLIESTQNEGKGASLIKGFDYALSNGYDAVVTMDGDGQHLPEEINSFLRLAEASDSAILIGNRMHKTRNMPLVRVATNKFMSWLISGVAGQNIPDTQCGFRLIKKEVLQKVRLSTAKYETESELLIKASRQGFKIESVPIKSVYVGEISRIHPVLDSLRFIRFIIGQLWTTKH
ncbi:MAG: glycosyltransferase family 2 protein [Candidatus Omnitrophica bacterium]|nr:glycosyltransferase family 2 protein [Candidatus Omnitrophota bacterium]